MEPIEAVWALPSSIEEASSHAWTLSPSLRGQRRSGWTSTAVTRLTTLRGRDRARTAEPWPGGASSAKLNSGTNYLVKGRQQMLGRDTRRLAASHSAWGRLVHPPLLYAQFCGKPMFRSLCRGGEAALSAPTWSSPGNSRVSRDQETCRTNLIDLEHRMKM